MAVSFVAQGTGSGNTSSGAGVSPGMPAGVQDGDLLLLHLAIDTTNDDNRPAFTLSETGWQRVPQRRWYKNDTSIALFWKRYETGDSAPSVTATGVPGGMLGKITAWRGVATSVYPIHGYNKSVNGSSGNVSYAGINGMGSPVMVIAIGQIASSSRSIDTISATDPATFTEIYDGSFGGESDQMFSMAYALQSSAGSTGSGSANISGSSATSVGVFLALVSAEQEAAWTDTPLLVGMDGQDKPSSDTDKQLTFSIPDNIQAGDFMVVALQKFTTSYTITPPSGWDTGPAVSTATGANSLDVFTRVYEEGDADPEFTYSDNTNRTGLLMVIRNANAITDSVTDTDTADDGTNPDLPALTTTAIGDAVLVFVAGQYPNGNGDNFAAPSYPSNVSDDWIYGSTDSEGDQGIAGAWGYADGVGSTGTGTFPSGSSNLQNRNVAVALLVNYVESGGGGGGSGNRIGGVGAIRRRPRADRGRRNRGGGGRGAGSGAGGRGSGRPDSPGRSDDAPGRGGPPRGGRPNPPAPPPPPPTPDPPTPPPPPPPEPPGPIPEPEVVEADDWPPSTLPGDDQGLPS